MKSYKTTIESEMFKRLFAKKLHTLRAGETLGKLAQMYNVTLEAIYKANPDITDPSKLQIGQSISIPENPMELSKELTGKDLDTMIDVIATKFDINKVLLKELMRQETTTFNAKAVSPVGAVGLMQLMPARIKDLGIEDAMDEAQNIAGGASLLDDYMGRARRLLGNGTNEEVEFIALLMYNGGPGHVRSWLDGKKKLHLETSNYGKEIFSRMGRAVPNRFKDKM